jgi:hypothetical protein
MLSINTLFSIVVLGLLVGCKPSRDNGCLSVASSEPKIGVTPDFVQGGYIHFGDKMCTATFEVSDVTADTISLRAYSARHCRVEKTTASVSNFVSLYFEKSNTRSAGFVQKIAAKEIFSARAEKARREVAALGVNGASELFADAFDIPVHYNPFGEGEFSGADAIVCNNIDFIGELDDPQKKLSQSCWSFLDLGVFDFEISKGSLGSKDFAYISERLKAKKAALNGFLSANPSLQGQYVEHRKRVHSVTGLMRLQKASRLAYLLNMDFCKISSAAGVDTAKMCSAQRRLIEIAGQNFIETDESGRQVNIFDKLSKLTDLSMPGESYANLLAGRRLAGHDSLTFANADEHARAYAVSMWHIFKDQTAIAIQSFRRVLKEHSGQTPEDKVSPVLSVSTNFAVKGKSGAADIRFGQFPLSFLSRQPDRFVFVKGFARDTKNDPDRMLFGVGFFGTLKMGVPREVEAIKFLPSDSGSLLSLKGVLPLMVLNTVDDKPTSGGASILALPEAKEEDIPAQNAGSGTGGKQTAANGDVTIDSSLFAGGVSCQ